MALHIARAIRLETVASESEEFVLPRTPDKDGHSDCSVIGPKNAEHPAAPPHVQPVLQIGQGVLPLDRTTISWRGRLAGIQLVERRPMAKDPRREMKLDQPHRIALHLERASLAQQRQDVVTDRQRTIVTRRYQAQIHTLPPLSGPCASGPDRPR
jgi:hypothetical protein